MVRLAPGSATSCTALRRGPQGHQIGHRLGAEGVEHGAAGGEAVRDPVGLAVLFEGRAAFAAADIDLDAGVLHPLELGDEGLGAGFEARVFEHAEDAVVKGDGRLAAVGVDEFADLLLEEGDRLRPNVELLIAGLQRFDDALVAELEIDGQDELDAVRLPAWTIRLACSMRSGGM